MFFFVVVVHVPQWGGFRVLMYFISLYLFVVPFILCGYYLGVASIQGVHSFLWESQGSDSRVSGAYELFSPLCGAHKLFRRTKAWHFCIPQVFIKINNVHGNLKDQMKLDLCVCEALSYMHVTMETAIVRIAINYH